MSVCSHSEQKVVNVQLYILSLRNVRSSSTTLLPQIFIRHFIFCCTAKAKTFGQHFARSYPMKQNRFGNKINRDIKPLISFFLMLFQQCKRPSIKRCTLGLSSMQTSRIVTITQTTHAQWNLTSVSIQVGRTPLSRPLVSAEAPGRLSCPCSPLPYSPQPVMVATVGGGLIYIWHRKKDSDSLLFALH